MQSHIFWLIPLLELCLGTKHDPADIDVTWILKMGSTVGNQHSHFGENTGLQRSAFKSPNYLGSRAGTASWKDPQGNLWLFGGEGFDDKLSNEPHLLNDLWVFNGTTQQWRLVNMSDVETQRTDSQHRQVPKPRKGAVACGVQGIMFVIFGGKDPGGHQLYDTWIYNIHKTTWLPLYVRFSAGKTLIHPAARSHSVSWCLSDKLVIYSGISANNTMLSDLWVFSLRTLEWKQVMSSGTQPQGRAGAAAWISSSTDLYMFGGSKYPGTATYSLSASENNALLNDVWRYNIKDNLWTLLKKATTTILSDPNNVPNPRQFCCHWTDLFGQLWISSGEGYSESQGFDFLNDTWSLNISSQTWTRVYDVMNSSLIPYSSEPTPRFMTTTWVNSNQTYVFGGFGYDGRRRLSFLNDLWALTSNQPGIVLALKQYEDESFLTRFTPGLIFLITMGSTASVACVFGMVFCLKKTIEYPSRGPSSAFNVRYTPLKNEASLEYS